MSDIRQTALIAYQRGLCVLPVKSDGSKGPDVERWGIYQRQRPNVDQLERWFGPHTGLGLVCGKVSGGLEMIELEGRAVHEGLLDELRNLADAIGLGPLLARVFAGYTESSPSGGIHVLYYTGQPRPNTKLASRPATPEELAAKPDEKVKVLAETRGEGGFVVIAPSNGKVHQSGGAWKLLTGGLESIASISADEQDQLHRLVCLFDQTPPSDLSERPRERTGEDRPGDHYNEQSDIQQQTVALLERHGWVKVYAHGGRDFLRRPGKDVGISGTVGYAGPGVFHNFSSSVAEFEPERSYSPFAVYAKLEHGDDWSAAAQALEPGFDLRLFSASDAMPAVRRDLDWPTPLGEAAYHGVIGELVRAVEESTEADPAALLGSMLAVFGAMCGSARTMHQGTWQAPHLYVTLVGESSSGRKGTALSVVRDIFRLVDPDYGRLVVAGLGSGEGLVGHMKRLRADGATENRALVLETELGRLLAVMAREGSTLSPILRDGWDGTPLGRVLARDDMLIEDHHVALLGHITPRELRAKLTSTDAANGFGNRFLWLAVRRQRLVPFPQPPDGLVHGLWPPLARAVAHAQEQLVLQWTPGAADAWQTFYAEHVSRARLGLIGALTARAEAQVTRLALIYALADAADAVDVAHLAAAREVWRYAEDSTRHIFGDSTGNRHADVLLRWLRAGEEYGWKEAKLALGLRTAADLEEVVELLTSADLAEVVERPRPEGGRPMRIIQSKGAKGAKDAAPAQEAEHE